MVVMMNPSLCIGAQPLVYLPPCSANGIALTLGISTSCLLLSRQFRGRYHPTRVSMQFQNQRKFPSLKAVVRKGFACNAALNAKCSQGQTQTITRESPTITQAPTHGKEKSPKLDDGGSGFPPRDGGGGGGGGGGGESFSGGFFLFGFLMLMGYLKDLEDEHDN